jgi:hypothetical protein
MLQSKFERIEAFGMKDSAIAPLMQSLQHLSISEGSSGVHSHPSIEILAGGLVSELQACEKRTNRLNAFLRVLQSLSFTGMRTRQSLIPDAHSSTFDWIFTPSKWAATDPRSQIRLHAWLAEGSGVYWISGKPGSGKSTLMKYLQRCRHMQTQLSSWAGSKRLVVAAYYFWLAGSDMQKSQEGLLRQLLFDILQSRPDWIPIILPERWEKLTGDEVLPIEVEQSLDFWPLSDLREAFTKLEKHQAAKHEGQTRICLFIDGLDEYSGEHSGLVRLIRGLGKVTDIKLCVASRPWNCFEDAFGQNPEAKLYLEILTKDDISNYARDMILDCEALVHATQTPKMIIDDLVRDISRRAQGVFLWVYLVVRSLREGISNGDPASILRERLHEMPDDLGEFFQRIVTSVDKVYRRRMAHTFQAALFSPQNLRLVLYAFLDEEHPRTPLSDGQTLLKALRTEEQLMARALNGRYKGLLETVGRPGHQEVHFLHRTVRDYLLEPRMQNLLSSYCRSDFNVFRLVCEAFISQEKAYPGSMNIETRSTDPIDFTLLDIFLSCARRLGDNPTCFRVIEEMNTAFHSMSPELRDTILLQTRLRQKSIAGNLFARAFELGVSSYTSRKLLTRQALSRNEFGAAMECALRPWLSLRTSEDYSQARESARIVRSLRSAVSYDFVKCESKTTLMRLAFNMPLPKVVREQLGTRICWIEIVSDLCDHGASITDLLILGQYKTDWVFLFELSCHLDPDAMLRFLQRLLLPRSLDVSVPVHQPAPTSDRREVCREMWPWCLVACCLAEDLVPDVPEFGEQRMEALLHIVQLFLDNDADPMSCQRRKLSPLLQTNLYPKGGFHEDAVLNVPLILKHVFRKHVELAKRVAAALERATERKRNMVDIVAEPQSRKRPTAIMDWDDQKRTRL